MARLTERIRFTLPADRKAELRRRAQAQGISLSELIRQMLRKDIPELRDTK